MKRDKETLKKLMREHKIQSYKSIFYCNIRNIKNMEELTEEEKLEIFDEFEQFLKKNRLDYLLNIVKIDSTKE